MFKNTIKKNELANKQFRQGNTMMTTDGVLGVPGIVLLVLTIENQNKGNTPYAW